MTQILMEIADTTAQGKLAVTLEVDTVFPDRQSL